VVVDDVGHEAGDAVVAAEALVKACGPGWWAARSIAAVQPIRQIGAAGLGTAN
jgi:hypothetical protein